ncbi:MAG: hypothetical protein JWR51_4469 [Devosia sp.]|uniref:hypothetical protein n=1 Tax=Devosia sp. TaxID=1871048 RepID=UPI0026307075|nr:hypothetical protein [Devosia sp.]MDB5531366.1 hypothetical protein [Devosia sp.]
MIRQCLNVLLLAALATPVAAQDNCVQAFTDEGAPIYFAPSSGHIVTVDSNFEWVRITLGDIDQTCKMAFQDRSNAGLGDTWFPSNAVKCKTFDTQLVYASPRDGGEQLLILDGMVLYPKCEE